MAQDDVRDLYHLISDSAVLVLAWHLVSSKKGARIAGLDGNTVKRVVKGIGRDTFLAELQSDLWSKTYDPMPVKARHAGARTVLIRSLKDRVVEEALCSILGPILEPSLHPQCFSYRRGSGTAEAVAEIRRVEDQFNYYVRADISACFESLPHRLVLHRLQLRIRDKQVIRLVRSLLEAGQTRPGRGIGQGTMIAPLLSNVALGDLDEKFPRGIGHLSEAMVTEVYDRLPAAPIRLLRPPVRNTTGRLTAPALLYLRYADDIVVLVQGSREQAEAVRQFTSVLLAKHKLELHPRKTKVGKLTDGFDFLGVNLRRSLDRPGLQVRVSENNIRRWAQHLRDIHDGVDSSALADLAVKFLQPRFDYFAQMGTDWTETAERLRQELFESER